jgi:hypothetical protein
VIAVDRLVTIIMPGFTDEGTMFDSTTTMTVIELGM